MENRISIPGLGEFDATSAFIGLERCSDGSFAVGRDGVVAIAATRDGKVEFIAFRDHSVAYVKSAMGCPAYYPIRPVSLKKPIRAVLMDLDGTSVRSERFWIHIIERTIASLVEDPKFHLDEVDLPCVSGHSVSEHLLYCIDRYCPHRTVEEARSFYHEHTRHHMAEILKGRGKEDVFTPTPGIKEFLLELKSMGVRIGLVTSGLYEKAWPEILSAFRTLRLGHPGRFYDAIITAGYPLRKGKAGTLGELPAKPHPWLYAEAARVGLGIPFEERNSVVGIEDSGAGVCSIRLAGFPAIGIAGGNIECSGMKDLCAHYVETFSDILRIIG